MINWISMCIASTKYLYVIYNFYVFQTIMVDCVGDLMVAISCNRQNVVNNQLFYYVGTGYHDLSLKNKIN